MPELPEVETIVRKLRPALLGRSVMAVEWVWERTLDRPAPAAAAAALLGAPIRSVERRGKYILISFATGKCLLIHLRMSGKFLVRLAGQGPGDSPHARVRLRLDDGVWLVFIDPRKFGRFYLVDDPQEILRGLGVEPMALEFSAEVLASALRTHRSEIKRLLLDQALVVGLGNIYANEALWSAGIHPRRAGDSLSPQEVQRLYAAIVGVLSRAIEDGGTSLEDRQYVYPDGGLGEHQVHLAVYDRAGEVCPRCGYRLERFEQGQRSTYFCPVCQPAP